MKSINYKTSGHGFVVRRILVILLCSLMTSGCSLYASLTSLKSEPESDNNVPSLPVNFGSNGLAIFQAKAFSLGGDNDSGSIAIQSDGKILVGGYAETTGSEDFAVVRYNIDGSLDTSFGTQGVFSYSFSNEDYDRVHAISLQNDGKIVLAGYSTDPVSGDSPFTILRLLPSGILDSDFGSNGQVRLFLGTSVDHSAEAIAFQSDGRIIIGGYYREGSQMKIVAVRLETDGTHDTTFGNSTGYARIDVSGGNNDLNELKVTSSDKIVIVGSSGSWDTLVVRLDSEGEYDNTFGTAGVYSSDRGGGARDSANDVVILGDGSLMVTGYHDTAGLYTSNIYLLKLTSSGVVDTSFNVTGFVSTDTGSNEENSRNIFPTTGGYFVTGSKGGLALTLKYTAAGALDTSFNGVGYVSTDPTTFYDSINSSAYYNGEIYYVGYIYDNTEDYLTFKLKSDGSLDTSVQGTGIIITDILTDRSSSVVDSVKLTNGKTLVASVLYGDNDELLSITRLNTDGTVDQTYGTNGSVIVGAVDTNYVDPGKMRLLSSGKVLLAGEIDGDGLIIRLTAEGLLDTSFNSSGILIVTNPAIFDGIEDVIETSDGNYMGIGFSNSEVALFKFTSSGVMDNSFGTAGISLAVVAGSDYGVSIHELADGKFIIGAGMSNKASILRMNSDGSLDTSFNGSGYVQHRVTGASSDIVKGLNVLSDGSYLLAGSSYITTNYDMFMIKVLPDGTLDSSFGTAGKLVLDLESGKHNQIGDFEVLANGKILVVGEIERSWVSSALILQFNSDGTLDSTFANSGIKEFEVIAGKEDSAKSLSVDSNNNIWVTCMSQFQLGYSAIAKFDSVGNLIP